MKHVLMALLIPLTSQGAVISGSESHGGDVLVCPNKPVVVLDYYYSSLPSPVLPQSELEDISKLDAKQVVNLFRNKLPKLFQAEFDRVNAKVGNLKQWVVADPVLSDINDEGLDVVLPSECHLVQAAIRKDSNVLINKNVLASISSSQLGILVIHEVLYTLAVEKGNESSWSVRPVVRELLKKEVNDKYLLNALSDMGWRNPKETIISYLMNADGKFLYYHFEESGMVNFDTISFDAADMASAQIHGTFFHAENAFEKIYNYTGWFNCDNNLVCRPTTADESNKYLPLPYGFYFEFLSANKLKMVIPGYPSKIISLKNHKFD